MSQNRVASRYAKSLLELAIEQKVEDRVHTDMLLLSSVGQQNRDFALMLSNPVIKHDKKLAVLREIFKDRVHVLTLSIFEIITKKQRESYLLSIADSFHDLFNESKGIISAEVTTTFALDSDLRNQVIAIVKSISGKDVELKETIKSDIIGGFVLRIGDRQIDDSINSKLNALKRKLGSNPYIKQI